MKDVIQSVLEILPSAAAEDLPVVVKFLMHALATTTFSIDPVDHETYRTEVLGKIRTDIQFVPGEDDAVTTGTQGN